ncbi:unnamed protein product [Wuchereria bancrofti]|nr:unnamed protein product [Wuchereria bancrofti]
MILPPHHQDSNTEARTLDTSQPQRMSWQKRSEKECELEGAKKNVKRTKHNGRANQEEEEEEEQR